MRNLQVGLLNRLKVIPILPCSKWTLRFKGSVSKPEKSKRYANTLNLPQTLFPLSMKHGAAAQRELEIQKTKEFQNLYSWQRQQNWTEEFVLHDGPPYANGKTHVGHTVNKVLKDITNRYKVMKKCKVHYVPGWDCHGMPIEVKAITDDMGQHQKLSPLEIRAKAKKFAEGVIREQRKSFMRWGIMADWSKSYLTMNPQYQEKQLEVFYKIYQKGFVYRNYMPVYWSPSSGTALAEAELEYNPEHVSKSVYLTFPLLTQPKVEQLDKVSGATVHAVIWTTTPWTLPFNQAICYNPGIRYAFLKCARSSNVYLCEESFVEKLKAIVGGDLELLCNVDGHTLEGTVYKHPLNQQELPFLPGEHVLPGKGTGLVHTAPAHGHDDFQVAVRNDLPLECHVDAQGRYTSGVDSSMVGKVVDDDANEAVLSALSKNVLQVENFTHSYPYDWRTKKPVIIRSSQQWFIDVSALRDQALECLSEVKISPPQSEGGMVSQLQSRPYWCISRQRTWGVPIPVFYHKESGEPLVTRETVDHLKELFRTQSPDCWWTLPVSELLPDRLLAELGKGQSSDYSRGEDILDIWFDSGVSWASVLAEVGGQADVYLEGIDQFKGWFQTSLLTSVAVNGRAPYKQIVTHSFATDEEGKKMSKSVGNVTDPEEVINGGKNKKTSPSYGVDVLRWWVAHSHHHQQIQVGPSILSRFHEDVFKVRKCVRHLLGNLFDFEPGVHSVPYDEMTAVDQYMLYVLSTTMQQIDEAYESISYHKVIQNIEKFVYSDLSSFYINITRDRCYCSDIDSKVRRSSQTVQYHIARTLTSAFAPVMPHLAEEIFQYIPGHDDADSDTDSIFKLGWCTPDLAWNNPDAAHRLMPVFDIRRDLLEELGTESPVDFDTLIYSSPQLHDLLRELQPETTSSTSPVCEVLQTSQVTILDKAPRSIPDDAVILAGSTRIQGSDTAEEVDYKVLLMSAALNLCERCRRYTATSSRAPCDRCMNSLADDWAS
ncbi:isoleucine--tRNA ligase, mitochondrial isoform X2 [Aplysia californica]|uniref:isoleucine--tRNA ligase n=1 Tax=Aplysia californica TaxID=6500 RepID=A0ABM0ZW67_APLCA|nr:isoleucine--tRNA ligase, mitochondrial isoform X2 [Aplysia californica]